MTASTATQAAHSRPAGGAIRNTRPPAAPTPHHSRARPEIARSASHSTIGTSASPRSRGIIGGRNVVAGVRAGIGPPWKGPASIVAMSNRWPWPSAAHPSEAAARNRPTLHVAARRRSQISIASSQMPVPAQARPNPCIAHTALSAPPGSAPAIQATSAWNSHG